MSRKSGQETSHLINSGGPRADKERQEPPDWQETTHFGVIYVLEADKEGGKRRESPASECNLLLITCYTLITVKLALQTRSSHHALTPWHFRSKLNTDKNPSAPREGSAGMKIREYSSQPLPPQWIFHSFICTPHWTGLTKKLRAANHLTLPLSSREPTVA